jgi:hypothetical protein
MSGYNLSSILEQVTTGFWERGTRGGSGSRVPRNWKPTRIPSPKFSSAWVPRDGTQNWHPYTGLSTNNWRKLSGLSPIHSMDIHQLVEVQWTVANAFPRTSANNWRKSYWRRAETSIETNVLFVEDSAKRVTIESDHHVTLDSKPIRHDPTLRLTEIFFFVLSIFKSFQPSDVKFSARQTTCKKVDVSVMKEKSIKILVFFMTHSLWYML